jgi:hypothetical protein
MSISKTNEAEAHLPNNFDLLNTKKKLHPAHFENFLANKPIF